MLRRLVTIAAALVTACSSPPRRSVELPAQSSSASSASALAIKPCYDPADWLRWLVAQAKSGELEALKRVALARQPRDADLDAAADALAVAAAGHDPDALARAEASADALLAAHPATCPPPAAHVFGRIPPVVIQQLVRARFGRMKRCYESALAKDPTLAGRLATKFVIGRDGNVASVSDASSGPDMLPDAEARACVVQEFATIAYPRPYGGIVTVIYPIIFKPDER